MGSCCGRRGSRRIRRSGETGGEQRKREGSFQGKQAPLQAGALARFPGDGFAFCFAADFGGADFAHGGVAGALAGAPHVPAGDGTVGAPALAEREQFFRLGFVFFAVGDGPAFLYAEVVDGENVGATEAENQKHFNCPGADAADGSQALDEFFVGEFLCVFECRHDPFDRLFREVLHGHDFCAGKAGFAERWFAKLEHFLRAGCAASRAERFDAAENGGSSFAGDGLVGDGFEESFVGALEMVLVHLESFGFSDEEFEFFVAFGERLHGFR